MNSRNNNNNPSDTQAVDLFAPANRFDSASRLHGRIHRWWLLAGRYWWLLVLVPLGVVVPVYLLTAGVPPAFESKARMWLTGRLDLGEGRIYTEELINYLGTQAELLRSQAIQDRALTRLREEFDFDPGALQADGAGQTGKAGVVRSIWKTLSGFGGGSDPAPGTNAQPKIPFEVKIAEGAKSSTLDLWVTGAEPDSTRAFLDCLMAEYLNFRRESRIQASDRMTASLNTQAEELLSRLDAQQKKLQSFQASNNIVILQGQGNSDANYLAKLNEQLSTLRTEQRLLERLQSGQGLEMETVEGGVLSGETPLDEAVGGDLLAGLAGPRLELFEANRELQLLKARHDELSENLKPSHPKIRDLNDEIAKQEKLIQISRDEVMKQLASRYKALGLRIQNLETASEEVDTKALETSRKMADYEQIRQDLNRTQEAYDRTLGLIQTVGVGKQVEQENIGILDPASEAAPTHPLVRNMAISLAGSLLLGFGLLYCIGLFKDDFASLEELSRHLSEPVVGQIPAISIRKPRGRLGIEALDKQRFEFLEAFRSIRSSLLFMGNGGTRPKTILVTSAVPDEGKSTVALYLAATLAKGNSRVLLIDADMRRATLHKFFGAKAGPGLAEVLDGEIPFGEAIVPTTLENLLLLPAGEASRNPGELVLSAVWPSFLNEAQSQFDFILVDTPPVMATNDAAVLAPKVDGALFVVRACFTSARMAQGALDVLRQRHVSMLGLIFNRAVSSPYEYHCYQRYGDSYRWRPKTAKRAAELVANIGGKGSGG